MKLRERVARTMLPMEEAQWRERGGEQDLMGQIDEKGAVKGRDVGVDW